MKLLGSLGFCGVLGEFGEFGESEEDPEEDPPPVRFLFLLDTTTATGTAMAAMIKIAIIVPY